MNDVEARKLAKDVAHWYRCREAGCPRCFVDLPNGERVAASYAHEVPVEVQLARYVLLGVKRNTRPDRKFTCRALGDEQEDSDGWTVAAFNHETLIGVVRFGDCEETFHSTSFESDTSFRFPRVGERVEIVWSLSGTLLSVHGK